MEFKMAAVSEKTSIDKSGTRIDLLDKSGFEDRHIMTVSGHKNDASIPSYSKTEDVGNPYNKMRG